MIYQSGNLTAYYLAILNWIETGESVFPFDTTYGLCGNAYVFCRQDEAATKVLVKEMQSQYEQAGLFYLLPFNDEGKGDVPYLDEANKYQNPKRLQWIKDHARI